MLLARSFKKSFFKRVNNNIIRIIDDKRCEKECVNSLVKEGMWRNAYQYTVLIDFFSCFFFAEIARVRGNLFHLSGTKTEPLELPEPIGPVVTLSEKVYVPVKEHPDVSAG